MQIFFTLTEFLSKICRRHVLAPGNSDDNAKYVRLYQVDPAGDRHFLSSKSEAELVVKRNQVYWYTNFKLVALIKEAISCHLEWSQTQNCAGFVRQKK
jgi:hypothetical protein